MERVAIMILNWNGLALTKACVAGLLQHQVPADIYILDNGSEHNEATELTKQFPGLTIERSHTNLGFTGGNNYWITRLQDQYDYLVLLNQDTIVTGDFLTPMLIYMDSHANTAVCGSSGGSVSLWTGKVASDGGTDCIIGYCFMMRTAAIQKVGLLTEQYFAYYEEADWCLRAKRFGYDCAVIKTNLLTHLKSSGFRTYYIARNMVWFMKRFASPLQLTWFFCYYFSIFWIERLRKGSTLRDFSRAAYDGWTKHLPTL